jgi:hypothetical protein
MVKANIRTIFFALAVTIAFLAIPAGRGASPQTPPPNSVPNRVVILDYMGIHPAKIVRPQGKFLLFISNRLVNRDEMFSLVSESSESGASAAVAAPLTTDNQHDCAYTLLDLPPGQYQLKLTNHASLSVQITITAQQ